MNYELFGDLLLVRVISSGNRTRGGLFIPDSSLDGTPWQNGEVVACSKGWHNANGVFIEMPVSVGDVCVFFRKSSSQVVFPVDGEDMLIVRFADVGMRLTGLDKVTSLKGVDGKTLVLQ